MLTTSVLSAEIVFIARMQMKQKRSVAGCGGFYDKEKCGANKELLLLCLLKVKKRKFFLEIRTELCGC